MTRTFKPSATHRFFSYLWPLRVKQHYGHSGDYLELLLYRNQWQLATEDALYSDGRRYAPFRLAFKKLPTTFLPKIQSCLILGTGLGSAAQLLHHHYNAHIHYTLVEVNEVILDWAEKILSLDGIYKIHPVRKDACDFMINNTSCFDLICIDVFIGRNIPECVLQSHFLQACKQALNPKGYCIMNFILHESKEWDYLLGLFYQYFSNVQIIIKGTNRILICQNLHTG